MVAAPRQREPLTTRATDRSSATDASPVRGYPGRGRPRLRPDPHEGVGELRRAVRVLGGRVLDGRTTLGRELAVWKQELIRDLGGPETVSTQQAALVELAVRTKLLIDSVDAYILAMGSPVNRRSRSLHPVVKERQTLAAQLQSLLRDLGLERRSKPVPPLAAYLAERRSAGCQPSGSTDPGGRAPLAEIGTPSSDSTDRGTEAT
jgi:hypothetical protein